VKTILFALLFLTLDFFFASTAQAGLTREGQTVLAKWTAEKICKMGVDDFYDIPEPEVSSLLEEETPLKYTDIPMMPTEQQRSRISNYISGYISGVCPSELEKYKNR
jgi:hypothetical protein|tara:strand:- start:111 stop:431 length:321 start_codon:yes stop_codon:yes gene_type:complete